ncbi:MAG: hypothetical protein VB853_10740, partial [Pirellulales bacterium]
MATDAQPRGAPGRAAQGRAATAEFGAAQVVREVLAAVASLKITVVLFTVAIFMILVVTLAQAHMDMWQATKEYFRPPLGIAWIQVDHLFPPAWFPAMETKEKGRYFALVALLATPIIAGLCYYIARKSVLREVTALLIGTFGEVTAIFCMYRHEFMFPGGSLIGMALIVNLLAAHSIRFKIQAKGQRLVIGLIVLVVGFALTFGVIYSGHGQQGAQEVSFYENATLYNAVWRG